MFIEGGHEKLVYRRELPKQEGRLGQFSDLRGEDLAKNRGGGGSGVFDGEEWGGLSQYTLYNWQ